jgi:hypothetical protein
VSGVRDRLAYAAAAARAVAKDPFIDVFVHDSMHTARNVRFEFDRAWPRPQEGGAAVVDDIERNPAFETFPRRTPSRDRPRALPTTVAPTSAACARSARRSRSYAPCSTW